MIHTALLIPTASGGFCLDQKTLPHLFTVYIPILVFESFLFGLVLVHGLRHHRSQLEPGLVAKFNCSSLYNILVRDSVLYFVA